MSTTIVNSNPEPVPENSPEKTLLSAEVLGAQVGEIKTLIETLPNRLKMEMGSLVDLSATLTALESIQTRLSALETQQTAMIALLDQMMETEESNSPDAGREDRESQNKAEPVEVEKIEQQPAPAKAKNPILKALLG